MPPPKAISGKLRIGEWVAEQRRAYAAGNLPDTWTWAVHVHQPIPPEGGTVTNDA